jgi:hypothetical protein
MSDIDQLERLLRRADPALGIDLAADGAVARRLYAEARQRADTVPAPIGPRHGALGRSQRQLAIQRRGLVLGVVAALAAIALVIVPGVWHGGTPAYGIRELPNGVIVIDWSKDSFAPNADAIAADLRELGVDVEITTLPSSPSAVGAVVATFPGEGDHVPEGLTVGEEGTPQAFTWTIDPRLFHGPVTLNVNVPASPGERYLSSNSVFMPGEVLGGLQCALGEPLRAADVAERLGGLGIAAVWDVVEPASVSTDHYTEHQVSEVPDGVLFAGYAVDDSTVELHVAPDGVSLSQLHASNLSDTPCTPAESAGWN